MSLDLFKEYTIRNSTQPCLPLSLNNSINLNVTYPEAERLRIDRISAEMECRNRNIGFVIGEGLRNLYDNSIDIFSKSYFAVKDYISSVKNKAFRDRVKKYVNPEYSELSKSEQICMVLDSGCEYASDDSIKIYIESEGLTKTQYELYNQAFHEVVEQFQEHSGINVEFVDFPNETDIIAGKFQALNSAIHESIVGEIGGRAQFPSEDTVQTFQIQSKYLVSYGSVDKYHHYSNFLRDLFLHEAGHGLIGLLHPFHVYSNLDSPNHWVDNFILGYFLDIPELTRMTYRSRGQSEHLFLRDKKLLKIGPGYCDVVVAQQKYGIQAAWYGQNIVEKLNENLGEAIILATKSASTFTLDARNITMQAVDFNLGPGFRPTKLKQTHYYIGPGENSLIQAYTSRLNDTVRFGHANSCVFVTGGAAKQFTIRPGLRFNKVYGFRIDLDTIRFEGINEDKLQIRFTKESIQFQVDPETFLNLYGISRDQYSSIKKFFKSDSEDDIDYIMNLYPDIFQISEKNQYILTFLSATLLTYIFYLIGKKNKIGHGTMDRNYFEAQIIQKKCELENYFECSSENEYDRDQEITINIENELHEYTCQFLRSSKTHKNKSQNDENLKQPICDAIGVKIK